jgi:hypothetical protein
LVGVSLASGLLRLVSRLPVLLLALLLGRRCAGAAAAAAGRASTAVLACRLLLLVVVVLLGLLEPLPSAGTPPVHTAGCEQSE